MATLGGGDGRYRYVLVPSVYGAIGEELKLARMDDIYELNFGGGVMLDGSSLDGSDLQSPGAGSHGSQGSLRELVEDSEPLVKESPQAARLLAANKTELYIPGSPPFGSPPASDSSWSAQHTPPTPSQASDVDSLPASRQARSEIDFSPTPRRPHSRVKGTRARTPQHRRISLAEIKRSPPHAKDDSNDFQIFLQPAQLAPVSPVDDESHPPIDVLSTPSLSASTPFEQKTYSELFDDINRKIDLVVRKHVAFELKPTPEVVKLLDLVAYHVNYDRVNIKICHVEQVQPALVHGMIWRFAYDEIFAKPVLDLAPSEFAEAYLYAWSSDIQCCTPAQRSHLWHEVKGPLMHTRTAAARLVIQTTPKYEDWVKTIAAARTDAIVDSLEPVWRHGRKDQVFYELFEPICKLVRVAIRMRTDLRHYDFNFFEYSTKARSDKMVHRNIDPMQIAPPADEDEDHHVVLTKSPEISEKNYELVRKETIYMAEVVVSKNFDNNGHLEVKHRGRCVRGRAPRTPQRGRNARHQS